VSREGTETLVRGSGVQLPVAALLRVKGAPATPKSFTLEVGTCTIGSAPTCDIVIADSAVSRTHAELSLVAEGVMLRDLGSRNGTFYAGQRVESIVLRLGSRIEIGRATISLDPTGLEDAVFAGHEYAGIVGHSPSMQRLFAKLTRLEGSLVPVLVEGETGVGKELVARALHHRSPCSAGPFVAINCGALPRDLVASELFGHRKGAFTNANEARRGAFDSADGGTLFLDELGELPLDVQPMLLRAVEAGEVRAVGSDTVKRVKVRVVAATNRQLEAEVRAGRFREDLFYRLAVVRVAIPPLRERREDIGPIARRIAAELSVELPDDVIDAWSARAWRGNVRELRNAVHAYAALGDLGEAPPAPAGPEVDASLAELVRVDAPYAEQKDALIERFTRVYLERLMAHTKGNQSQAARLAGLDRTYLGRLLAKVGKE
jgi:DNA-binding NtrC family response regulator